MNKHCYYSKVLFLVIENAKIPLSVSTSKKIQNDENANMHHA